MAAEKSPAFQFYVRDWRSSRKVQVMSFKERGMYLEMLIEQWDKGAAPSSPKDCAAALGGTEIDWQRSFAVLAACFSPRKRDGGFVNAKLEAIRRSKKRFHKEQQGKAVAKWHGAQPAGKKVSRAERLSLARKRGYHTREQWELMHAAYGRCLKCGIPATELKGEQCVKDHVVPLYQGGDDSIQNIQPMCRNCNSQKGSENIDYRVGLAETRPEWLPNACQNGADASSATAIASATATADLKNPPTPFQGGRLKRAELKAAKDIRSKVYGRCPHDPRCETYTRCVEAIALARRSA